VIIKGSEKIYITVFLDELMGFGDIMNSIGSGFGAIGGSLVNDLSILWLLTPILFFWIVLEVYFSKYQSEKLGWNTALGNGMSIFWILIISMRELFSEGWSGLVWSRFFGLMILFVYTGFIIYNSFAHKLPEKVSFIIASPTITYYLSAVAILWTFGGLVITGWVILDLLLIYGVVLILEVILKKYVQRETGGSSLGGL
jgi:hypothetical protein|tara:strand:- start:497 stop:1093 length:597 start_codon:yes stop_codon:yes gene_type:complete